MLLEKLFIKAKKRFWSTPAKQRHNHSVVISKPHLWNGLKTLTLYSPDIGKKGRKIIDEITQPLGLLYHTDPEKVFS